MKDDGGAAFFGSTRFPFRVSASKNWQFCDDSRLPGAASPQCLRFRKARDRAARNAPSFRSPTLS